MSAFHSCHNCGYVTDISTTTLTAFEEDPHCRQCGLSVSESDAKVHDELAAMMARNLTLIPTAPQSVSAPPTPQVGPQIIPITYASAHYHHSGHVAPVYVDAQVSSVLEGHGVKASALLPSQLQLFRNAPPDQQQRLVELWKIAPPTYGTQMQGQQLNNWPQTSMDQEEAAARERYKQHEQDRLQTLSTLSISDRPAMAEPYMDAGYRRSSDPIYQGKEWWNVGAEQPMEHQYGMMQQVRHLQDVTASNTDKDEQMW